jgi:glutaredoxin
MREMSGKGGTMKQECRLPSIWTMWVVIPGAALAVGFARGWLACLFVVLAGVLFQIGYVRLLPYVSRWLGYGSVADVPPPEPRGHGNALRHVRLYTAAGCPFCPIVRQRLERLQRELGFELEEEDVTFHPRRLSSRSIRSVPVIEMDGRVLVGNATSERLLEFLEGGAADAA